MNNNFTLRNTGYLTKSEYDQLLKDYKNNKLKPTSKEKLIINPKVAYQVTDEMIEKSIPTNILEYKTLYGKINRFSKHSPVSNLLWDYLYFVNPDVFRPAAIAFEKSLLAGGKKKANYCSFPKGTTAYKKYWKEEFKRCTLGYEPIIDDKPCGLRISGEFYFYLNYSMINKIVEEKDGSTKNVEFFPDFLAMDYYYFRELEARENPSFFNLPLEYKKSFVLTKSRRKGFSFKAASSSAWIIAFNNNAKVAIASAPDTYKTDAALAAKKVVPILDHLSNYTPFGRKKLGDVRNNGGWKNEVSSITDTKVSITMGVFNTRTKEKSGRQSSLITMSLSKDDAASGEGLRRLYFEEAGKASNLSKAWGFARESMKAGSYYRGLAIIFGCFVGDTLVYNNFGKAVKIKDLNVKKGIVGFSSKNLMPQKINALKVPIKKECIELKTQFGTIICSTDHPMLVTYYDNSNHKYNKDYTDEDPKAFLRNNRTLSCWYERADKLTKDHCLLIPNLDKANSSFLFGKAKLNINCKHIDNWLLNKFIKYIINNKKIPDEVWQLDKQSTWNFISALFDLYGEGFAYYVDNSHKGTKVLYSLSLKKLLGRYSNIDKNVKKELALELKMLMFKTGLIAYIKGDDQRIASLSKGSFSDHYNNLEDNDLYISNPSETLKLFIQNTKFQRKDLKEIAKDFVPNLMHYKLSKNVNVLENLNLTSNDYKFPEKLYFINDITVKNNDMYSDHIENVYKFKILGTPKILKEEQTVYNLNCSPNHNYLANGYIAGNTGGEMVTDGGDTGRSKSFANLFNNPEANDLAAFNNIYDYQPTGQKCGFFISDMWANFGAKIKINGESFSALDKKGNAFFWVAELALNKERLSKLPPNGTQKDYNLFLTQRCKTPSEAFFATKGSIFNTADLIAVQSSIESMKYSFAKYYTAGELLEDKEGYISFKPDLENSLQPITSMNYDNANKEGALLIYEHPKKIEGAVPSNAYIISCDPIGQDTSTGKSLVSIIVMKTPVYNTYDDFGYEGVVATYIGRKQYNPMTFARELLLRLSKYYNAKITYENDRDGGILQDFTNRGELNRLLPSPELIMNKHLPNSTTRLRKFGHSMATVHHKTLGETLLNEWLDYRHPTIKGLNYKDEYVEKIGPRNMDLLKDQMILEQLISYNRKGNFDAVMTLMGAIIQMKELFDVRLLENQERTKKNINSVKKWVKRVLGNEEHRKGGYKYIQLD